jgi:hypothetical protein
MAVLANNNATSNLGRFLSKFLISLVQLRETVNQRYAARQKANVRDQLSICYFGDAPKPLVSNICLVYSPLVKIVHD